MSPTRFTWIIAFTLPLLGHALVHAQENARPAEPTPANKVAPAEELLDEAIKKLGNLEWLDTKFEQEVRTSGVKVRSTGRIVLASKDHKLRYDLEVRVADAKGSSQIICDGQTIWRVERIQNAKPTVIRYGYADLQSARDSIDRSQLDPQKIDALLKDIEEENGFRGIQPTLRDLRLGMTFPRVESSQLDGVPVYVMDGEWLPATRDKLIDETIARHNQRVPEEMRKRVIEAWDKRQEFIMLPRFARVYLAKETLWPLAIEWYGPARPEGDNVLLVRLAFRQSAANRPSEAELNELFSVPEDLRKGSQVLDPKAIVAARRERLAKQEQAMQEFNRNRPLDSGKP